MDKTSEGYTDTQTTSSSGGYSTQTPSTARHYFRIIWRTIKKYPTGAFGLLILVLVLIFTLSAGVLTPYRYDRTISTKAAPIMSRGFENELLVLGGDELGRDILTRLQHAGRTSFVIGIAAPLLGVTIGTIIGIVSAYKGGVFDLLVQRVIDVLISLPGLVLAMAVTLALGFSIWGVIIALAINSVGNASRVVRSHALTQSQLEYVQAAKALGSSDMRMIFRHLLPNSMAVSLVLFTVGVGTAITAEAGLSFLGLGVQPPTPSWGNMLTFAQQYFRFGAHIAILPGLTIAIVVFAINLVGDSLRDILDPRLRGRG